jgi:hypothetical protein
VTADQRQKAKPTNFGLLYGMKAEGLYARGVDDYGLSWSRKEAADARHAWFSLYPEFRLWHRCTSLLQFRNIPKDRCILWNPYERELTHPERDIIRCSLHRVSAQLLPSTEQALL